MKDKEMIKALERDTSVSFHEWKEIVILTSFTSESSVESNLKHKFDLEDKYINFICRKFLKRTQNNNN